MTKQKLGVFAEVAGELKLIHTGSVRFSRANRAALKMGQYYPGVFFSTYHTVDGDGETVSKDRFEPTGERHKPAQVTWQSLGLKAPEPMFPVAQQVPLKNRKRRSRKILGREINYDERDPQTGERLGDVMVDIIRERLARGEH